MNGHQGGRVTIFHNAFLDIRIITHLNRFCMEHGGVLLLPSNKRRGMGHGKHARGDGV